jgi:hypothetical protein
MLNNLQKVVMNHILHDFTAYDWDVDDEDKQPYGWLSSGISNCLYRLESQYQQGKFTKDDVKETLIAAYQQDVYIWWSLTSYNVYEDLLPWEDQEEPEDGIQPVCADVWLQHFNLVTEENEWELNELYSEKYYHPEFLKLFIKKYAWDVMFPNEDLPHYTEPRSGDIRLLTYPLALNFEQLARIHSNKSDDLKSAQT